MSKRHIHIHTYTHLFLQHIHTKTNLFIPHLFHSPFLPLFVYTHILSISFSSIQPFYQQSLLHFLSIQSYNPSFPSLHPSLPSSNSPCKIIPLWLHGPFPLSPPTYNYSIFTRGLFSLSPSLPLSLLPSLSYPHSLPPAYSNSSAISTA